MSAVPPLHCVTPLLESRPLSLHAQRDVWLKLDALQPTGSFKIRGIGHACQNAMAQGARRLVSSSGGNAGLAVAYAGRRMSIAVTVVVPETSSARARELLSQEGAELLVHGASWQEANELAMSLLGEGDAFIHPFDDPQIWRGHSTLVDEIVQSGLRPDAIVLSVGGGGLLSGVAEGLHRHGWDEVPIVAVETLGAESFHRAQLAGCLVELPSINSIASSLGARQVCEQALAWSRQHVIHSVVVSDGAALRACQRFLDDHRILVEPACGASLAVLYELAEQLQEFRRPLVIVCGGATATVEQIGRWLQELGQRSGS